MNLALLPLLGRMTKAIFSNSRHYLTTALMLPVIGLLAFTGCSSIDGTAQNQMAPKNHVAAYLEQTQEKSQPVDSNPDPTYEWFY